MENRMMKKNFYTFLALFTLLLFACNKNKGSDKIIDVEKEFTFQLWEQLDEFGGNFQLVASTIQTPKCGGTHITYTQNSIGSKITLTLKDLAPPLNCNGKLEQAVDTISLGNLPKGTYKLNINLKDAILNDGTLFVEDKKYTVSMAKSDGIEMPQREILRVPKGAIWGYFSYDNGQEAKVTKFTDKLTSMTSPLSISQGDYGYFNVKSSSVEIKLPFDTKKANTKQLFTTLNSGISRQELQNSIQDARNQGLDLKVFTFEGKTF
jgi:hypothetical protein